MGSARGTFVLVTFQLAGVTAGSLSTTRVGTGWTLGSTGQWGIFDSLPADAGDRDVNVDGTRLAVPEMTE